MDHTKYADAILNLVRLKTPGINERVSIEYKLYPFSQSPDVENQRQEAQTQKRAT